MTEPTDALRGLPAGVLGTRVDAAVRYRLSGGVQSLTVSGSGRYVRVNGTARATAYGYSRWEFQVYGS